MDQNAQKKEQGTGDQEILLGEENMPEYGFSRFCYPEEKENITRDGYRLILSGEAGNAGFQSLKIFIPHEYIFALSREKDLKLSRHEDFFVDSVPGRIDQMKILSSRARWNQTDGDLRMLTRLAGHSNYHAKIRIRNHEIALGCGTVVPVGEDLQWISMILVHPEVRRQGIAAAIMYHGLKEARIPGKEQIIGLDATPGGKKLYDQLGFTQSFEIWRCIVPASSGFEVLPGLTITPLKNYAVINEYLRERGFPDKSTLFPMLMKLYPGGCFVARSGRKVVGFVFSRAGAVKPYIGPLVADDLATAGNLLAKVQAYWGERHMDDLYMDIPSRHIRPALDEIQPGEIIQSVGNFQKGQPWEGIRAMRKFDRMYHCLSGNHWDRIRYFFNGEMQDMEQLAILLEVSAASLEITRAYMENEKSILTRYQYAIAGPEYC